MYNFFLSSLACRFSFAFERWKEVINCMINKKIDSFRSNQLWVIYLFEADYNLVVGLVFGRYMTHWICDNQLFHPSQWGRPNRECKAVFVLNKLTYQVATMSRTPSTTTHHHAMIASSPASPYYAAAPTVSPKVLVVWRPKCWTTSRQLMVYRKTSTQTKLLCPFTEWDKAARTAPACGAFLVQFFFEAPTNFCMALRERIPSKTSTNAP